MRLFVACLVMFLLVPDCISSDRCKWELVLPMEFCDKKEIVVHNVDQKTGKCTSTLVCYKISYFETLEECQKECEREEIEDNI